jgi:hypothetical protein
VIEGGYIMRKRDKIKQKLQDMTDKDILRAMRDTLDNAYTIFRKKLGDYGSDAFKMAGGMGILWKINEKFKRMDHLLRIEGEPNYESIEDTISDLAIWSHILKSLMEKELVDINEVKGDYMDKYGKIEKLDENEDEFI